MITSSESKIEAECHTTSVILFDLIGYSKLSDEDQFALVKILFNHIPEMLRLLFGQASWRTDEILLGTIATGDGAYLILRHTVAEYGVLFALSLRTIILQKLKDFKKPICSGVRIGVHLGVVMPIEIFGRQNFVGTGLNDCARLLAQEPCPQQLAEIECPDNNWVIASSDAYDFFHEKFSFPDGLKYRDVIKLRSSAPFEFLDKHKKNHTVRLLESSRYVATIPPRPPDFLKRVEEAGRARRSGQAGESGTP